jgi:hypothetical protein
MASSAPEQGSRSRLRIAVLRTALGLAFVLASSLSTCTLSEAARAGWRSDFEGLVAHLERCYPNLEWIVEHRGLDAHALAESTRAAIDGADSQFDCAAALRSFVAAFHDPHLRIEEPWHSPLTLFWRGATWSRMPSALSPDEACDRLGLDERPGGIELDFEDVPGFEELPADDRQPFAAGLLPLPGGGYVDGGDPFVLPYAGWTVLVPNCCRFRLDGTSEIEGITPDVELEFDGDEWLEALLGELVAQGAERSR